ncbi:MAG: threonine/serine exporter family protein [Chordicoccus sp.]
MKEREQIIHALLDFGEEFLISGAEISRVEDTISRIGMAFGAQKMNVFVITSNIIITINWPDGSSLTETRRIRRDTSNDFVKLEELNALSRRFCAAPFSIREFGRRLTGISGIHSSGREVLFGSVLVASAFALFFGGNAADAAVAGAVAVFIFWMQTYIQPICLNTISFTCAASFLSGFLISAIAFLIPALHRDKILIGDIMLLVPGIMFTNAFREVLLGDTISGLLRLLEAILLAAAMALGIMAAIWLAGQLF